MQLPVSVGVVRDNAVMLALLSAQTPLELVTRRGMCDQPDKSLQIHT